MGIWRKGVLAKLKEQWSVEVHVCLTQWGQHSRALSWGTRDLTQELQRHRQERTHNKRPLLVNKTTCKPTVKMFIQQMLMGHRGYKKEYDTVLLYGPCSPDGETKMSIKKHNTIYLGYPQEHRLNLLLDNVAKTMNKWGNTTMKIQWLSFSNYQGFIIITKKQQMKIVKFSKWQVVLSFIKSVFEKNINTCICQLRLIIWHFVPTFLKSFKAASAPNLAS